MPLSESIDASVLAYYNSLDVAERVHFRGTLGGPERERFERLGQLTPGVDAEGVEVSVEPAPGALAFTSGPAQTPQFTVQQHTDTSMSDFPAEDLKQACGEDWCIKTCGSVTCIMIILIVVLVPSSLDKVSSEQTASSEQAANVLLCKAIWVTC